MALLIKTNGNTEMVSPANGETFTLAELQKFVGGYIEVLFTPDNEYALIVNEEGKLYDLPYNELATSRAKSSGCIYGSDYIVGDMLACEVNEIE